MKIINIKEKFESKVKEIWTNEKFLDIDRNVLSRGYVMPDKVITDSILFIGINPSYSEKEVKKNENILEPKILPYFEKFKDISEKIKIIDTHTDLLFFREREQKYIDYLLKSKIGIDFIYQQLMISKQIIILSKPKVIVVSNTKAREFMGFDKNLERTQGVWMDLDFEFDENLGTHKIVNDSDLENVPVFFTSMLSGQRALDNGSYQRLIWHIKYVLNKL